jgi:hypothetical protein
MRPSILIPNFGEPRLNGNRLDSEAWHAHHFGHDKKVGMMCSSCVSECHNIHMLQSKLFWSTHNVTKLTPRNPRLSMIRVNVVQVAAWCSQSTSSHGMNQLLWFLAVRCKLAPHPSPSRIVVKSRFSIMKISTPAPRC